MITIPETHKLNVKWIQEIQEKIRWLEIRRDAHREMIDDLYEKNKFQKDRHYALAWDVGKAKEDIEELREEAKELEPRVTCLEQMI